MGVSMRTVAILRAQGHNAVHLRDEHLQRLPDHEIVNKARREQRIVLTFDLDFGRLLAADQSRDPSVIIFRLNDQAPDWVSARLSVTIAAKACELEDGALLIVEDTRVRVRRLPIFKPEMN